ncbi:MAG TPA: hypothetical protein VFR86_14040 [Burkholderiaceae bacterium]|nr:hypothetical protein [Burkholderiaceae bacterium]
MAVTSAAGATTPWASRAVRALGFAVAAACTAMTYALYTAPYWALGAWPWPEQQMSFVFLASIVASIGMVWLSVAVTGELAALAGVGVNMLVASLGACLFLALQTWQTGRDDLLPAIVLSGVSSAFGVWLWRWAGRLAVRDPRPMPAFMYRACIVIVVTPIVAGSALVLQRQVFPWLLQAETATLFGFIFLGAAAYFVHAAVRRRWAFAVPPLLGFLVFDLVLFVPYAKLLADPGAVDDIYGGEPVNRTSLAIYLAVLASSTLLALYALLLHPATRWRAARAASAP